MSIKTQFNLLGDAENKVKFFFIDGMTSTLSSFSKLLNKLFVLIKKLRVKIISIELKICRKI